MRLIDADELKAKLNKAVKNAVEDHCEYASAFINAAQEWSAELWAVEDTIDDAPTVDAVSLEFIKEAITRLRRRRMNLDEEFVDEAWYLTLQIEAFNDLLSEWVERMKEE